MATNPASPRLGTRGLSSNAIRFGSLVLVVITIVALGAVAFFTEHGIVLGRDSVIHCYQVRSQLDDLQLQIIRAHAGASGYPLTAEEQGGSSDDTLHQTLDSVRELTRDDPKQRERLAELQPLVEQEMAEIQNRQGAWGSGAQILGQAGTRQQIDDLDKHSDALVKAMRDKEAVVLQQRLTDWDYLFKRNVLLLGLAFAVVAVMLAYNFWLLIAEVSRARAAARLVKANAESYKLMSARILELQDSERRRIARELHDSVGQFLAGLKINLSQLGTASPADAPRLLNETLKLTDYTIQEVRTISHLLHPPLLEELGFLSAARWYVDEYGKRSQAKVSLLVDEPIGRLPRDVEIALFRVLQETLTNVYRHAAAQSVDVRMHYFDGEVHLTVSDDGKGIPEEILSKFREGAALGIGLAGMRERLAEFGGQIHVESSTAGSVVEAVIPIAAIATPRAATHPARG
jgi:signal transduction histidine kinase